MGARNKLGWLSVVVLATCAWACAAGDSSATGFTDVGGSAGSGASGAGGGSSGKAGSAGKSGNAGSSGKAGSSGTSNGGDAGSSGTGGNNGGNSGSSGAAGTGATTGGSSGSSGTGGNPSGNLDLCVLNTGGPTDPCLNPEILDYGTIPVNSQLTRLFRYDNDTGQTVKFVNVAVQGTDPSTFDVVTSQYVDDPTNPGTLMRVVAPIPVNVPQGDALYFEVTYNSDGTAGPLPGDATVVTASIGADAPQNYLVPMVGEKSGCPTGLGSCDNDPSNGCETDIFTSMDHCGGCNKPCAPMNASATCDQGVCTLNNCNAPFSDCNMMASDGCEINLFNDVLNCGACGFDCTKDFTDSFCNGGNCGITACAQGHADCDLDANNGCEVDVTTSLGNCGQCNLNCDYANASETCTNGTCVFGGCDVGFADCNNDLSDGCEVDLNNDTNHCGTCAVVCSFDHADVLCTQGQCELGACNGGFGNCDSNDANGCESNLNTSVSHCGDCATACDFQNAGDACVGGTCTMGTCDANFANCNGDDADGCEVNIHTSLNNCGGCNLVCNLPNATEQCNNGSCEILQCANGFADCNNNPLDGCEVNTNTNLQNCGACNQLCDIPNANEACVNGTCTLSNCPTGTADCNLNQADGCEINIFSSLANCGACGQVCNAPHASESCTNGVCVMGACDPGFANCDSDNANGCEVNTNTTLQHCGGCNQNCDLANASESCTNGVCTLGACNTGFADCDNNPANGCETNLNSSLSHCGACGAGCSIPNAIEACLGGFCAMLGCDPGFANCNGSQADGCEVNTTNTLAHCGGCNLNCNYANAAETCTAGVCTFAGCNNGFADCDSDLSNGCETNTKTSLQNCGGCNIACDLANASESCTNGVCTLGTCSSGFANCDNDPTNGCEVNTTTSLANCGACNQACALSNASEACLGGTCVLTSCDAGFANCDNNSTNGCEVNTNTSLANCGGCNQACDLANAGESCVSGVCTLGACSAGFANCNMLASDGCETNTNTSLSNCGGCNIACDLANAAESCVSGTCTLGACNTNFGNCNANAADGCETNLLTNVSNCGNCGTICTTTNGTPTCNSGACGISSCNSGFGNCDGNTTNGCETNTNTSASNCGACNNVCNIANGVAGCTNGACSVASCNSGFGNCDGSAANGCETNTNTSASNCGACNNVCALANATNNCTSGTCGIASCNAGFGNCDGNTANGCETNTNTNASNCGSCGNICNLSHANNTCTGGSCTIGSCQSGYANCNNTTGDGCEVNTNTDVNNCGGCGNVCAFANAGAACVNGTCTMTTCNSGFGNCDGNNANGCEQSLTTLSHCGGCGVTCDFANAAESCASGTCVMGACNAGFANCDSNNANGCEVNTNTSLSNCGGCGQACDYPNATESCTAGVCTFGACNAGFGNCDGTLTNLTNGCEVNTNTSLTHCGACNNGCNYPNASESCVNGACTFGTCDAGRGNCDNILTNGVNGCEIDTTSNVSNCGACGTTCASQCVGNVTSTSCSASSCLITGCSAGYFNIDGLCNTGCECLQTAVGSTCSTATGVPTIALGGSTTKSGNLVPAGQEAWYSVTFTYSASTSYHPKVTISSAGGSTFKFDVYSACGSPNTPKNGCTASGDAATSTGLTTWEVDDTSTLTPEYTPTTNVGTILVRVYRASGTVNCSDQYTLTITDLGQPTVALTTSPYRLVVFVLSPPLRCFLSARSVCSASRDTTLPYSHNAMIGMRLVMRSRTDRRQQILLKARDVFSKHGYHATKVDDIIAAAGVARGTFYLYFSDKRAAFEELVDRFFARIAMAIQHVDTSKDVDPQIDENVRRIVGILFEDRAMAKILLADVVGVDPEFDRKVGRFYEEIERLFIESLEEGQRLGLVRDGDPRLLVFLTLGGLKELMLQLITRDLGYEVETIVREIRRFLEVGFLTVRREANGARPSGTSQQ